MWGLGFRVPSILCLSNTVRFLARHWRGKKKRHGNRKEINSYLGLQRGCPGLIYQEIRVFWLSQPQTKGTTTIIVLF